MKTARTDKYNIANELITYPRRNDREVWIEFIRV